MSETPSTQEYLLLSRGRWDADKSPQEIQAAIDAFYDWHAGLVAEGKFKPGQRLAPGERGGRPPAARCSWPAPTARRTQSIRKK